jgi:serine/threonine-protein kinase TTK/MPS1
MLQKIQCIPNPNYKIEYPTIIPSQTPGQEPIQVDPDAIRVIQSCLVRNPKERATIPQLLQDPFLKPGGSPVGKHARAAQRSCRDESLT